MTGASSHPGPATGAFVPGEGGGAPAAPPVVLSIAGSDPSGGAGIQADLKTFAAHRVYGAAVVTALTAQNTTGVRDVFPVPVMAVVDQLSAVLDDLRPAAVKVGMLGGAGAAAAVAVRARSGHLPNLVLDPVLRASSGHRLGAVRAVEQLLPYATVLTPNAAEASAFVGRPVTTPADMAGAAEELAGTGARCVVVTGGDLDGDEVCDVLWTPKGTRLLRASRIPTRNTHGTGCTFSSAIAARLARGEPVAAAVLAAKEYVTRALRRAATWRIGAGRGPVDHAAPVGGMVSADGVEPAGGSVGGARLAGDADLGDVAGRSAASVRPGAPARAAATASTTTPDRDNQKEAS